MITVAKEALDLRDCLWLFRCFTSFEVYRATVECRHRNGFCLSRADFLGVINLNCIFSDTYVDREGKRNKKEGFGTVGCHDERTGEHYEFGELENLVATPLALDLGRDRLV